MRNPFFLLLVFALSAWAAGWLYPGNRTPDLAPNAGAGRESEVPEENLLKTVKATVARVDPEAGMITLKGPYGEFKAFGTGEGQENFLEVKVGDQVVMTYRETTAAQVLGPGNGPVAAAQKEVTRSEPNEAPPEAMVQLVKMTAAVESSDAPQDLAPPKGPLEESAAITIPDLTDL